VECALARSRWTSPPGRTSSACAGLQLRMAGTGGLVRTRASGPRLMPRVTTQDTTVSD